MAILDRINVGNLEILVSDSNPTSGGVAALLGSLILMSDGSGFYVKTSSSDTSWNKAVDTASLASITATGTITSGIWNGTVINAIYGGTGQSVYAVGDILYASSTSALSKRNIGTTDQVLTVSGGLPVWITRTAKFPYTATGVDYTVLNTDTTIDCTATGINITLPNAVTNAGAIFIIKKSVSDGTITVSTTSSQTIDGSLSQTINGKNWIVVQSNGINYIIIG